MSRAVRFLAIVIALATAGVARGAETVPDTLPGVEKDYSIVTPAKPEPEPSSTGNEPLKIGDWDVRISGRVSLEMGYGKRPDGGRPSLDE